MTEFKAFLERLGQDRDKLVSMARESLARLMPACQKMDKEHDGMQLITCIMLASVAADGSVNAAEKQFIGEVLGLDETQVERCVAMRREYMASVVKVFAMNLSRELKEDVLVVIACFIACDGVATEKELTFTAGFLKLLK